MIGIGGLCGPAPESTRGSGARMLPAVALLEALGIVLFGVVAAILRFGKIYIIPANLEELCGDSNYKRPSRDPVISVPPYAVATMAIAGPLVMILLLEVVKARLENLSISVRKNWVVFVFHRFVKLMLLFLLGLFLTSAVTDFLRIFFSRPKPFFLYNYNIYCREGLPGEDDLSDADLDARLSFPSYSCTMLAYSGAVVALRAELALRYVGGVCVLRPALAVVGFFPSLLVASQAVFSRQNHWEDVAVGLALGVVLGSYVSLVLMGDERRSRLQPGPLTRSHQVSPIEGKNNEQIELPRAKLRTPSIEAIHAGFNLPYVRQYSRKLDSEDSFY